MAPARTGSLEGSLEQRSFFESLRDFVAGMRAAVVFLTRIPCGPWPVTPAAQRWAPAHFPVVGGGLGVLGAAVFTALGRAGGWVAAASAMVVLVLVTGAFHEDGLADTADALGGAFEREKIFAILKDSRIGSFGAVALILSLLLRTATLASLGPAAVGGLVLGQTLSRMTPVWLLVVLPYVTPAATSRSSDIATARAPQAIGATCFAAAIGAGLFMLRLVPGIGVVVSFGLAVVAAVLCGWRFHVRAGGITGDFLGATQQVTEVVILVGLATSR